MWANAQRDGRPAEQVAPSVQRHSMADAHYYMPCSNAAKTRNQLKFGGCPKLTKQFQPLVGESSPYWCLTSFFSDCRYVP